MTRLVIILLCLFSFRLHGETVDVFLIAGQSNASGRVSDGFVADPSDSHIRYYYNTDGPAGTSHDSAGAFTTLRDLSNGYYGFEVSAGLELFDAGYRPAILKISEGGTDLASDWNSQSDGYMWQRWKEQAAIALQELIDSDYKVRLRAFFWMQGESDSNESSKAASYSKNFEILTNDVGSYLQGLGYDTSELQFVTGLVQNVRDHSIEVRQAQRNHMRSMSNGSWLDTEDLTTSDGIHFDSDSVNVLGQRFAQRYIDSVKQVTTGIPPRPNVILIMVDDMGWSDVGAYGSEIQTPHLDRLAEEGLRFTNFYNTSKCFTSRSCLLTGVYAQRTGTDTSVSQISNAATLGEVLQSAGYTTLASGKHHGTDNLYDRGFDHYYGLRDGASNHFNPGLRRDGELMPASKGRTRYWVDDALVFDTRDPSYQSYFPENFYTTDVFTDKAIEYLDQAADTGKPFFLYLSYTAPHDPLMAWPEDIAKYDGVYDAGYAAVRADRYQRQQELGLLSAENHPLSSAGHRNWSDLSASQKADEARRMEVYAAMIDRVDQNIGHLLERLDELGVRDNTLILFCSDNGGSAESTSRGDMTAEIGGLDRFASLKADWSNVSNTPFRYFKTFSYEGGIRTPLIVNWPDGIINPGRIVRQPGHLVDFMATIMDLAGADYPLTANGESIVALDGESFVSDLLDEPNAARGPIFFQWSDGKAMINWPWKIVKEGGGDWQLFNLEEDGSETVDLANAETDLLNDFVSRHEAWIESSTQALPVVKDDLVQVSHGSTTNLNLLENDTDPDGEIVGLEISDWPSHGSIKSKGLDQLTFVPESTAFRTDGFSYKVQDDNGAWSQTARVRLVVSNNQEIIYETEDGTLIDSDGQKK